MHSFRDDDAGYLAWVENHPEGFVVNADRSPRAEELVLHKANCFSIRNPKKPAGAWTHRAYIKVCSEVPAELERWARDETGGTLRPCGQCHPV
jgi:hypothetical protein